MSDLLDLYQEVILDHNRKPRNYGPMEDADSQVNGENPLCGDKLTLYVKWRDNRVENLSFEGSGCAISIASTSLMTEIIKGKTREEASDLIHLFHQALTGSGKKIPELSGKLAALKGVRAYPARVKCATLSWHTLNASLKKGQTHYTETQ